MHAIIASSSRAEVPPSIQDQVTLLQQALFGIDEDELDLDPDLLDLRNSEILDDEDVEKGARKGKALIVSPLLRRKKRRAKKAMQMRLAMDLESCMEGYL